MTDRDTRGHGGRPDGEAAGQAAVEVALVIPVIAVLLMAVVQVGLVVRDQVLVVEAAREAARAASADPSPGAADRAIRATSPLKVARVSTETSYLGGSSDIVRVEVQYLAPTDVPLVGAFLPDMTLEANAAMRSEFGQS